MELDKETLHWVISGVGSLLTGGLAWFVRSTSDKLKTQIDLANAILSRTVSAELSQKLGPLDRSDAATEEKIRSLERRVEEIEDVMRGIRDSMSIQLRLLRQNTKKLRSINTN